MSIGFYRMSFNLNTAHIKMLWGHIEHKTCIEKMPGGAENERYPFRLFNECSEIKAKAFMHTTPEATK